jgi:hypothetical protein
MPIPGTVVHLNNSGGIDWLDRRQLNTLERAGWIVHTSPYGRVYHVSTTAPVDLARELFRALTGEDPDARGCDCCGRPFSFYAVSDITDPYSNA